MSPIVNSVFFSSITRGSLAAAADAPNSWTQMFWVIWIILFCSLLAKWSKIKPKTEASRLCACPVPRFALSFMASESFHLDNGSIHCIEGDAASVADQISSVTVGQRLASNTLAWGKQAERDRHRDRKSERYSLRASRHAVLIVNSESWICLLFLS